MEDLHKNDANCKNVPGYIKLLLAKAEEVEDIVLISQTKKSVVFKIPENGWGDVHGKSITLSHTCAKDTHTVDITCILQAIQADIEVTLADMCGQRYIAKLVDRNGVAWLAGSKEEPLRFSYEHIGEAKASGLHAYKIRLSRSMTNPLFRL